MSSEEDMLEYERECVEDYEFEGIMIRSPKGLYKFGRSTVKQGYLLKLKRFKDAEAKIVGFEEMMHNQNELGVDALGHAKRSSKKEGMVPAGVLGAFIVEMDDGTTFKVSTGMTHEDRDSYWKTRDTMIGQLVKYKFQESDGKPRFPVFLGIRHSDDT
jgi:DNA ligase-1